MSDPMDRPLAVGQIIYWRRRTDPPSTDPEVFCHHIKHLAGDNIIGVVENPLYTQDLTWFDTSRLEIVRVEDPSL